jgi:hypothetical protein
MRSLLSAAFRPFVSLLLSTPMLQEATATHSNLVCALNASVTGSNCSRLRVLSLSVLRLAPVRSNAAHALRSINLSSYVCAYGVGTRLCVCVCVFARHTVVRVCVFARVRLSVSFLWSAIVSAVRKCDFALLIFHS